MFFTKHGYQRNGGECEALGHRGLPGEAEEGGEEEGGGVEEVRPADNADDWLHMEGVAAKQGAAHQAQQPGVGGVRLAGEPSEETIQQEGVEAVQADVDHFVRFA